MAQSWFGGSIVMLSVLVPLGVRAQGPAPADASADTAPIERLDIESLLDLPVVTASGKEESRGLASANVVSVTREDIQAHGWRSLAEILESIPGLYVVDDHVNASVGVRGVTGGLGAGTRIVRVMVDGVQVNFRPDLSAFIGPEFIPIETVERVEVAKGPLSALYGANAFLATVNVITRKGEDGSSAQVGLRGVSVNGRDGMGASGSASYRGESGGVFAAFSMDRVDRSGLFIQRTFSAQDPALPRYQAFFSGPSRGDLANPVSGFLHVDAGNEASGIFSLRGGYQREDAMGEFRLSSALTHESRVVLENFWTSARHERKWSDAFSTQVSFGYSRGGTGREYSLELTSNPMLEFIPHVGYWAATGQAEAAYSGIPRLELRGGADAEYQMQQALHYEQIFLAPQGYNQPGDRVTLVPAGATTRYPVTNLGSYLQAAYTPLANLPGLRFTGNIRFDHIVYGPVQFPLQYSWRAAAVYGISSEVNAKLVMGRAFQTPSGVLMFAYPGFGYFNNVVGNVNVVGRPLRPQDVNSLEAVVNANVLRFAVVEVGAYFQEIKDTIQFLKLGTDFVAANEGWTRNAGIELSARLQVGAFSPYISASFQHALDRKILEPSPSYPDAFGQVGTVLNLPQQHLRASVDLSLVGPRGATQANTLFNNDRAYQLKPYARLDATVSSVGLHPLGEDKETRVCATVRNALDARYSEPGFGGFDIPAQGRSVLIEVRQTF